MDTDSGLDAESSQHICLSYVCHKPAGSKTALEVAHTGTLHMKFQTKQAKERLRSKFLFWDLMLSMHQATTERLAMQRMQTLNGARVLSGLDSQYKLH